jgi:hypothetical protein
LVETAAIAIEARETVFSGLSVMSTHGPQLGRQP